MQDYTIFKFSFFLLGLMIVLGIETTAHTFGIGIVREKNGKVEILSNERDMYKPKKGGIHPREAADHHSEVANDIYSKALEKAGIKENEIDAIAFSLGPGLPPTLKVGSFFARYLSLKLGKPLYGVNHCVAHVEIGKFTSRFNDPVTLYVSGGNTQILAFASGKYRVFGETQDIGIGNALDAFARDNGIGFPGGPVIEQLALKAKKYIKMPYTVKGMDVAFSGLITDAQKQLKKNSLEDICHSIQETAFAMLVETTERALAHTEKNEVLLTGGVAANKRLGEILEIMCKERGAKFAVVPKEYCMDNGAMVGYTGLLAAKTQKPLNLKDSAFDQIWRTDQVEISWL